MFQVGGDVTTNDSSIPGTGVVDFSRTTAGTQNIYVGHDYDQLPNVKIDSAGTVMLGAAKLSISGNWDYDQGTFDAGTSTVQFTGGGTAKIDTGSSSFDNAIIDRSGYISTIDADTSAAGVMNVAGSLTINKLGNLTGPTHASGDVTTNAATSIGGTGVIDFVGIGSHNVSGGAAYGQSPNVRITGGTVNLIDTLSIGGNWDYDGGAFTAAGSTVKFTGGGTAKIDTGSSSFDNVIIDRSGYISTIDADTSAAGEMNVAGSLTINKLGNLTGLIHASGHVTTNATSIGGTGVIDFVGSGVQTRVRTTTSVNCPTSRSISRAARLRSERPTRCRSGGTGTTTPGRSARWEARSSSPAAAPPRSTPARRPSTTRSSTALATSARSTPTPAPLAR